MTLPATRVRAANLFIIHRQRLLNNGLRHRRSSTECFSPAFKWSSWTEALFSLAAPVFVSCKSMETAHVCPLFSDERGSGGPPQFRNLLVKTKLVFLFVKTSTFGRWRLFNGFSGILSINWATQHHLGLTLIWRVIKINLKKLKTNSKKINKKN